MLRIRVSPPMMSSTGVSGIDDAELVPRHQKFEHFERRKIRHVHLGHVPDRSGHAAGTIERDRKRKQALAHLLALFHRNRQHLLERRAVVAADRKRIAPAGHHEPERTGFHQIREERHAVRAEA